MEYLVTITCTSDGTGRQVQFKKEDFAYSINWELETAPNGMSGPVQKIERLPLRLDINGNIHHHV